VPTHPDALNNLGNIFKEIGLLEWANSTYKKVIALAPQHADVRANIAVVLHETLSTSKKHLNNYKAQLRLIPITLKHTTT
jgi:Flp pilus assembly protein TadD